MARFTLPGRKTLAGLAVAGLVLVGGMGTALADEETANGAASRYQQFTERLATLLGKQPDEVRNAITQVHSQYIDEAVAAGKIPADRAQELKDRAAQGGVPFLGGPGRGPGHGGKLFRMLMGEVASVDGQTLTIKGPDGTEKTVLLTDTTEIRKGRETADVSAITVGAHVAIHGEPDEQGVVTAERVHIHDGELGPRPGGRRGNRGPGEQPPTSAS